jgi:hypothetical protein
VNNAHIIRCSDEIRCRQMAANLALDEGREVWLHGKFSNVDILVKHRREEVLLTSSTAI